MKIIVILGQTASGKTELAIELAKKFNGEIICADSRTIYKGMDIGTAKPDKKDRQKAKHHLLDVIEPDERFNANQFKVMANKFIKDIGSRGKIPFMVGGTGLYISSVVYDFSFNKEVANDTDMRDDCLIIGLSVDPQQLKLRIKKRVDQMIDEGLEGEVRELVKKYGFNAPGLNAICYKEWKAYFADELSLDELKQKMCTNTWQYARRQKTWFKRDPNIHWTTSVKQASVLAQQFLIQ